MKRKIILSWRNLWRNKKRTYITVASVLFAVIIATFMRGLQLGSYDKIYNDAIRNSTGHFAIMDKAYWDDKSLVNSFEIPEGMEEQLDKDEEIDFYAPQVMGGGLLSYGNSTRAVLVQGVVPEIMNQQMHIKDKIIKGEFLDEKDEALLIGKELAAFLKVDIGDTVVILGQGYMGVTAAGKYPVKGIFDHPMAEFNKRMSFLSLPAAQYLFFMDNRLTNLNVVLHDPDQLELMMDKYTTQIDTTVLTTRSWKLMNEELIQGMESDNFFGQIMIGILYMVIGFGLFGTILMMTMERKKEFSIMIAIGMKRTKLLSQVILESIMIAVIGAVIGLILSFPVVYFYHINPIEITGENAKIYLEMGMEPVLQISLKPGYMVVQFMIVFVLSLFASLLPLYNIMRFNIVDIIRGKQ